jgi:hypothetical protein
MLNKQNETVLLIKLGVMLKEEMRLSRRERDKELIAILKRTIDDLKQQRKRKGVRGHD